METKTFRTNLNCQSCVSKAAPFLDGDKSITKWDVDINDDRKVLSITGDSIDPERVRSAVRKSGFDVFEEIGAQPITSPTESKSTYYPLLLIFLYLIGGIAIAQFRAGSFNWTTAMHQFMGGFFVVFSFFKILNLRGFADAYATYDIVAKKIRAYGFFYPFIELELGILYLTGVAHFYTNLATLIVMSVSSIGVIQSLLKKNKIQCACLGTIFNLPMSKITLIEDLLMVVMAAIGLFSTLL